MTTAGDDGDDGNDASRRNDGTGSPGPARRFPDDAPPDGAADDLSGLSHDQRVDADARPLVDHLIELRTRMIRVVVVLIVTFVPLYFVADQLYALASAPLIAQLPPNASMIATQVASPFFAPFKLAVFTALFIAMPYLLHQAWSFVAPGLYANEKRFAVPLLVSSVVLFYTGIAFAYYIVFPVMFEFFRNVNPAGVIIMTDINHYLDFALKLFFAFGVAFEVPVATFLLITTGLVSSATLGRSRPYVFLGCFVLAMLLTPPDVVSQIMLGVPAWLLFEIGMLFGRAFERRREADSPG